MKTTLSVGDKSINVVCNAFTPILFRQIFKRDFLVEFSSMSDKATELIKKSQDLAKLQKDLEDKAITQEEYLKRFTDLDISSESIESMNNRSELASMLLFVMNKQSEEEEPMKLYKLSEVDYFSFLCQFEKGELNTASVIGQVLAVWKNDSKALVESKNA